MPELPDPEHTTIGRGASGLWWCRCTRPWCTYIGAATTREQAHQFAANHQLHHRRRGLYR